MIEFPGIDENESKNAAIKSLWNHAGSSLPSEVSAAVVEQIALKMPSTAPIQQEYNAQANSLAAARSAGQTAPILCPRFMMQAGFPLRYDYGWWYDTFYGIGKISSYSWRLADDFVKYFGASNRTTNFSTFSTKVSAGSAIAYDDANDGDSEHCAYGTMANSSPSTQGGR